jgi:hypothetical protein
MGRHALDLEKVGAGCEEEFGAGSTLDGIEGLTGSCADIRVGILLASLEGADGQALANSSEGVDGSQAQIPIVVGEGEDQGLDGSLAAVMEWFGECGGAGFAGFDFSDSSEDVGGRLADPVFLVFEGRLELRGDSMGGLTAGPVRVEHLEGIISGLSDRVFRVNESEDEWADGAEVTDLFQDARGRLADFAIGVGKQGEDGFGGVGISEAAESEGGSFADFPFGIGQGFDKRLDGLGVAELAEGFGGEGTDVFVRIFEGEDERGDGAGIAQATEGLDGGGADGFLMIFEDIEEDAEDAAIGDLAEGFDGGLALVVSAVVNDQHERFEGVGPEQGCFLDFAEGDGVVSAREIVVGLPVKGIEGFGCLPADGSDGVAQGIDERWDGVAATDEAEGLGGSLSDGRIQVVQRGHEGGDGAVVLEIAEGLGDRLADGVVRVLEGINEGLPRFRVVLLAKFFHSLKALFPASRLKLLDRPPDHGMKASRARVG